MIDLSPDAWNTLRELGLSIITFLTFYLTLRNNNRIKKASGKVEEVHQLVNSGLITQKDEAKKSGIDEGIIQEKNNQRIRDQIELERKEKK